MAAYERALALEERLGAAPLAARTRYSYARVLLERAGPSDVERATRLLQAGRDTATALGMAKLEEQMTSLLGT